jgi:hypothetical protein
MRQPPVPISDQNTDVNFLGRHTETRTNGQTINFK